MCIRDSDEAAFANSCGGIGGGATMNRDVFAQSRPVTDAAMTNRSAKREVLWKIANHAPGMNAAVAANVRVTEQMHVRSNGCVSTNMHRAVDNAVRTDLSSGINHGIRVNDCGRMNRHQAALKRDEPENERTKCNRWSRHSALARVSLPNKFSIIYEAANSAEM